MKIENEVKLDFIDVLIRPKRSTLSSRSQVNLVKTFNFVNSRQNWTGVPIITSNMDTIGTFNMYNKLKHYKIITCLSKHYSVEDFPDDLDKEYYMLSTGISDAEYDKLTRLIEKLDPKFICVDVANGYMNKLVSFVKKLRDNYPSIVIACGNVVSREMVEELILNGGADIVKVGIGSGSVCTTRLKTGVGMPQLSAVLECSDAAHGISGAIISDGGITCPGDISKALGGGADFVMLGSMLSGHEECLGDLIEEDGVKYKLFYGMSSSNAMNKYHGGVAKYRSSEGKCVRIKYKGPVCNTIDDILGGVRSTCTYIGASRVKDIPKCTTFMMVNRQVNTIHNGKEV